MQINFLIWLLQLVSLCAQHINIVVQTIVLFFSLDKRSNNFFNWWNASRFFNLLKSIFYNFNVSYVLIHKSFFFFICCYNFSQSHFKNNNMVGNWINRSLLLASSVFSRVHFVCFKYHIAFIFLQISFHFSNVWIKFFLICIVSWHQSNCLTSMVFWKTKVHHLLFVLFQRITFGFFYVVA